MAVSSTAPSPLLQVDGPDEEQCSLLDQGETSHSRWLSLRKALCPTLLGSAALLFIGAVATGLALTPRAHQTRGSNDFLSAIVSDADAQFHDIGYMNMFQQVLTGCESQAPWNKKPCYDGAYSHDSTCRKERQDGKLPSCQAIRACLQGWVFKAPESPCGQCDGHSQLQSTCRAQFGAILKLSDICVNEEKDVKMLEYRLGVTWGYVDGMVHECQLMNPHV
mmetsp:Transcript_74750/g.120703  ORF Transcript_74750/g.120703 Transcript_74750/m.120703 type:complete len:221 (+) Transcript_74750:107-769(+)